jgi:hypothetical protein
MELSQGTVIVSRARSRTREFNLTRESPAACACGLQLPNKQTQLDYQVDHVSKELLHRRIHLYEHLMELDKQLIFWVCYKYVPPTHPPPVTIVPD